MGGRSKSGSCMRVAETGPQNIIILQTVARLGLLLQSLPPRVTALPYSDATPIVSHTLIPVTGHDHSGRIKSFLQRIPTLARRRQCWIHVLTNNHTKPPGGDMLIPHEAGPFNPAPHMFIALLFALSTTTTALHSISSRPVSPPASESTTCSSPRSVVTCSFLVSAVDPLRSGWKPVLGDTGAAEMKRATISSVSFVNSNKPLLPGCGCHQ